MKLLFDQNLSPRLVRRLVDLFPESAHVTDVGLDRADDDAIWVFARDERYAIVTKDSDFDDMSVLRGFPPKIIWIRLGNCTSHQIEALLRAHAETIASFESDPTAGVLSLS